MFYIVICVLSDIDLLDFNNFFFIVCWLCNNVVLPKANLGENKKE